MLLFLSESRNNKTKFTLLYSIHLNVGAWLEHRLMRQLLYTSLTEEDIIKRDCKIYKTTHLQLIKNIYISSSTQFTFIFLRPGGLYSFLQILFKKLLLY